MCYDLNEYDPIELICIYSNNGYYELELVTEPMGDYDWEEWLSND